MGLLDYLNNGFDNSVGHLNNLKDSFANQPKMYDPHANAQALMGGTPMQYNQQPQSLIANTPQVNNQVSNVPTNITPQQTQQITYGAPVGANMGQINTETSEVSSYDDSNGYDPTKVAQANPNYNNRITAPMHPSLLMGAPEIYQEPVGEREVGFTTQVDNAVNNTGVNSMVAQQYPAMSLGESFTPTIDPTEMAKREEAKRKLQALFGGKL